VENRERSGLVKLKIGGNLQGEPIFCLICTVAILASHEKGRDGADPRGPRRHDKRNANLPSQQADWNG